MAGTFKPYRRTVIAASAVGLAVLGAAVTGPGIESASAGEPATPQTAGQASAIAQSYKVDPRTAALSLGISFGVSLAGYTNNVAQAESRGIDLGIIGSTLAAILFAAIGSSLIFVNISAYWLRAVQGLLILATVLADMARRHRIK